MRSIFFYPVTIIAVICIISCAGSNSQIKLEKSIKKYSMPQTSTEVLKGEKVNYELWFNKNKWEIRDSETEIYKELKKNMGKDGTSLSYVLFHTSNEVVGLIMEHRINKSIETYYKQSVNALGSGERIIAEDIRTVNGKDVLYMKLIQKDSNYNNMSIAYYLPTKTGHMMVLCSTSEHLFSEYESDVTDLLNGLVDSNSYIEPAKSDDYIESKLSKLKSLRDKGLITQKDYDKKKDKLLNSY